MSKLNKKEMECVDYLLDYQIEVNGSAYLELYYNDSKNEKEMTVYCDLIEKNHIEFMILKDENWYSYTKEEVLNEIEEDLYNEVLKDIAETKKENLGLIMKTVRRYSLEKETEKCIEKFKNFLENEVYDLMLQSALNMQYSYSIKASEFFPSEHLNIHDKLYPLLEKFGKEKNIKAYSHYGSFIFEWE